MFGRACLFILAASFAGSHALLLQRESASSGANPIRKVVSMLQAMQKKVTQDGEKAEAAHEKHMCWCTHGAAALTTSISDAKGKLGQLKSTLTEKVEKKAAAEGSLKQNQVNRDAAKASIAKASALRAKEAAAFAASESDDKDLIATIQGALAALEKGVAGGFLQTRAAQTLLKKANNFQGLSDVDRDDLVAFLSGSHSSTYAPQSGSIIGILKQMLDSTGKTLADATAAEESAVSSHAQLVAANEKELGSLSAAIEAGLERIAALGVDVARLPNDIADLAQSLADDTKFLSDLGASCKTKEAEWQAEKKNRADELVALADTIKVLNDDDALELFKKTLPGSASSFLQLSAEATQKSQALAALRTAGLHATDHSRSQLEMISLALRGKKIGFEKVTGMIDELIETLKADQTDDDHKLEYCNKELDLANDKRKTLERGVANAASAVEAAKESIAAVAEEIASLQAGIKALDGRVADMTNDRKEESAAYADLISSDTAAKKLLGFAKNRLNKFYNPKMYIAPPERELAAEDRIVVGMGGTAPPTAPPGGIAGTGISFAQVAALPPPPEAAPAYAKKNAESTGVIAMIDLLVADLDKEMTEAKTAETDAQNDYETAMKDAANQRAADAKSLTDKAAAKADVETELQRSAGEGDATKSELSATVKFIQSLHGECDWLIKYHSVRQEARVGEAESLKTAKAVLAGADFSSFF